MVYLRSQMTSVFRLLLMSVFAGLVAAGLIGCAVFSAGVHAQTPPAMTASMDHDHHAGHAMAGHEVAPEPGGHDHSHESCDGCENSLLNRATIDLDAAAAPTLVPLPGFIIPAALRLDPPSGFVARRGWPPGKGPPLRPLTLTHQNISLLI